MRKNHSKIVCIKLVHLPYLEEKKLGTMKKKGLKQKKGREDDQRDKGKKRMDVRGSGRGLFDGTISVLAQYQMRKLREIYKLSGTEGRTRCLPYKK